jgi:IS5 family transposase
MNQVVPWPELVASVQLQALGRVSGTRWPPTVPIEKMLRIYCLQLWGNLSDPPMEELHERPLFRSLVGLDGAERVPDQTMVLRFWRLLEKQGLACWQSSIAVCRSWN